MPSFNLFRSKTVKTSFSLVLLGTGESGKSSIIKRSIKIKQEYERLRGIINFILLETIASIKRYSESESSCIEFDNVENSKLWSKLLETEPFKEHNLRFVPSRYWNDDYARMVFSVYQDTGFQRELFERRATLPFIESVNYFIKEENIQRMLNINFKLTTEDCFFASMKTSGIVDRSKYSNNPCLEIIDTGGQRTERKKWHNISTIDTTKKLVIGFVVSLSEFDQLCFEDHITNRFEEGLSTFKEWYDSPLVSEHRLYLIFNKFDVLEEKIKKGILFSQFVPEFKGDDSNIQSIIEFIVKKYKEMDVNGKVVKHFVISCLESKQVHQMLDEISETEQ